MIKQFLSLIEKTPLFHQISASGISRMLECLDASIRDFKQQEYIFFAGNPALRVGLVLQGSVQITRDDVFGNRIILSTLAPGDLFGETFACAGVETLPVHAVAVSNCKILLMDYRKMIHTCPSACGFHHQIIENMLHIIAMKNLFLNQMVEIVSARTTREKLLIFLMAQAGRVGSVSFEIPFNRQELADYLSVDRSAMSTELGRMRDDGLLRFHKNHFELLNRD